MRMCIGGKGKEPDRPNQIDKAQMKVSHEEKWALKPSVSLWPPAKRSQLHIMVPHCWTCLPNTARHRVVPKRNHWEVLRTEHDIALRPVVGKSALRVIRGLPRLVIWCCSSYYSALEGKLTRTLNHIICGCLFWFPLLLLLCEGQLVSSSSSAGQKAEDEYKLLHWEMR